ncbi:Gfo/Idh/MocA family oxidoreductase [Chromatiaceae bacterium AAb-1]|nr:Gfo/Idh/MocA family oxidoreductase [Chromatiaceae bacterium AAb-1]
MIRIGLLGAARITDKAIFQPLRQLDGFVVQAVAASDIQKATAYAEQHGILHVAPGYQALLERDDIDLIYNALPPSAHCHWTVQALQHGKHVLCEKPFAMDADEARQMVDAARQHQRVLIEAFHYRFHPLFAEVQRLLASGILGRVNLIRSNFSVRVPFSPGSLRHVAALGGGAVMDLGCYPLHWVRTLMAEEPEVIRAACITGEPQIDITTEALLRFSNGCQAYVGCSMAEHLSKVHEAYIMLEGELGSLEVFGLIAPHQGNRIILHTAAGQQTYSVAGESTYYYQLQHVRDCLLHQATPLTGGDDAVKTMQLIDQVYLNAGLQSRGQCR